MLSVLKPVSKFTLLSMMFINSGEVFLHFHILCIFQGPFIWRSWWFKGPSSSLHGFCAFVGLPHVSTEGIVINYNLLSLSLELCIVLYTTFYLVGLPFLFSVIVIFTALIKFNLCGHFFVLITRINFLRRNFLELSKSLYSVVVFHLYLALCLLLCNIVFLFE